MAGSRALATRCPACGTVFRVVPDQLRVSDGWVRCGRCAEVFNAPETLVDMDTGTSQRLPEAERQTLVAAPASAADITTGLADVPANDAEAWTPHALPSEQPVTPLSSEEARHAQADEPDNAGKPELDFGADPPTAEPGAEQGALPDPRAEPEDRPPPSFVRRAEQAARWRQPRVRLALGAGAAVAALALAAQVVYTYRDLAAARWPSTRPALEQACAALRCDIGAPRLVAGLAVQSSGLSRVETSDQYRLAMTLHARRLRPPSPPVCVPIPRHHAFVGDHEAAAGFEDFELFKALVQIVCEDFKTEILFGKRRDELVRLDVFAKNHRIDHRAQAVTISLGVQPLHDDRVGKLTRCNQQIDQ